MSQSIVVINGVRYDAATGLPVDTHSDSQLESTFAVKRTHPSHEIHRHVQRSQTLNRQAVRKNAPQHVAPKATVQRSPLVSKFATHPDKATAKPRMMADIAPVVHPVVQKAQQRIENKQQQAATIIKPADVIKKEAIQEALEKAPSHHAARPVKKSAGRTPRAFSLVSVTLALLMLGGYFTYINLPSLSVRVAAAQAGINANYPAYRPDGYRLAGVSYSKGAVSMKFAANAGPQNFTITQQQTGWDSTAVKENYVKPNWGDDVMPYAEHGLTIYAHDGNAVWVNGGILYTISGDAPLSGSQVRGIATNL